MFTWGVYGCWGCHCLPGVCMVARGVNGYLCMVAVECQCLPGVCMVANGVNMYLECVWYLGMSMFTWGAYGCWRC